MATKWKQINLRLPADLLKDIDRERGLVPRNAWIIAKLTDKDPQKQAFVEPVVHQLMDEADTKDVSGPARMNKPLLQRPIIQKRH